MTHNSNAFHYRPQVPVGGRPLDSTRSFATQHQDLAEVLDLDSYQTKITHLKAMTPVYERTERGNGTAVDNIVGIQHDGVTYKVESDRFIGSLTSRFGFSPSVFSMFSPAEVFDRLQSRRANTAVRFTTLGETALGIAKPQADVVAPASLAWALVDKNANLKGIKYKDGIVTTYHGVANPEVNGFSISGDSWDAGFVVNTPIDGFGNPAAYLELIRQVCTNGMMMISPAFRSEMRVNGDPVPLLRRVFSTYTNDQGIEVLNRRLETAKNTFASMREVDKMRKFVAIGSPAGLALGEMISQKVESFGLADVASLSEKRMAILPVNATVYDLINIATEAATHGTGGMMDNNRIYGFATNLLIDQSDLEGTDNLGSCPSSKAFYTMN